MTTNQGDTCGRGTEPRDRGTQGNPGKTTTLVRLALPPASSLSEATTAEASFPAGPPPNGQPTNATPLWGTS